ncbi:MAG TPA: DUF4249 domain-containing protein, partial [Chitinophagaceae bacterium]|nr:DUF4249 domain-containing protein [Chitinophagaceae bacterium]
DNSAQVNLSKATPLANDDGHVPEIQATVRIEDDNGGIYSLIEEADGMYTLANMDLSLSKKYRLSIVRGNGKEYFTDYVELKQTPPIDSISWAPTARRDGINIYANTHDENNSSRYYQWRFVETWEYTSKYFPAYEIRNGTILPNGVNVNQCWTTKASSEILIASSTQLNENAIRNFPLIFIPKGSPKISRRYSILVEQRSLSKDAYDFWNELKKTTENLGGLFDPLPSKVIGNLRSKNDSEEPVLGYFSGGSTAEQRIFIRVGELPEDIWLFPFQACPVDSIPVDRISNYPNMFLIGTYGTPVVLGYTYSSDTNCMDCRDNGGDLKKPDFWE